MSCFEFVMDQCKGGKHIPAQKLSSLAAVSNWFWVSWQSPLTLNWSFPSPRIQKFNLISVQHSPQWMLHPPQTHSSPPLACQFIHTIYLTLEGKSRMLLNQNHLLLLLLWLLLLGKRSVGSQFVTTTNNNNTRRTFAKGATCCRWAPMVPRPLFNQSKDIFTLHLRWILKLLQWTQGNNKLTDSSIQNRNFRFWILNMPLKMKWPLRRLL